MGKSGSKYFYTHLEKMDDRETMTTNNKSCGLTYKIEKLKVHTKQDFINWLSDNPKCLHKIEFMQYIKFRSQVISSMHKVYI